MSDWKDNIATFMQSECDAILGPAGAGYTQEPVAVYAVAVARIEFLEAALASAEADRDAGLIREKDANVKAMHHLRRAEKAEIAGKNHAAFSHEWRNRAEALTAQLAQRDAALKAADELAEWVERIIEDGCPKCGGDCSSANPPVAYCPMLEVTQDLAAYRKARGQDATAKG